MISNQIFVDSSWFKALADPSDDFSESAAEQYETFKKNNALLVTTNYILDESFTLIRVKVDLQSALDFRQMLASFGPSLKLVRVTPRDEERAWEWFPKNWGKLSFTDCTSFAVMKRLNLEEAATFDNHFAKAGFKIFS